MTFLSDIKKLFEAEPVVKPDESFPNESEPGYWEDKSATGIVYEPPVPNGGWAPTDDQVLPGYRGVEEHGVPYDAAVNYVVPNSEALNEPSSGDDDDDNEGVEYDTVTPLAPIAVNVVSMPEPVGVEKRIATNQIPITKGTVVQIAPQSHSRTSLWIAITGNDVAYIARDPQAAQVNGFQVRAGLGNFSIDTTDALYAWVPASAAQDALVYTMENYDVSVNQRVE